MSIDFIQYQYIKELIECELTRVAQIRSSDFSIHYFVYEQLNETLTYLNGLFDENNELKKSQYRPTSFHKEATAVFERNISSCDHSLKYYIEKTKPNSPLCEYIKETTIMSFKLKKEIMQRLHEAMSTL